MKRIFNLKNGSQLSLMGDLYAVKNQKFQYRFRAFYVLNAQAISDYSFRTITKIKWSRRLFEWQKHPDFIKETVANPVYQKLLKIACEGVFANSLENSFVERWSDELRSLFHYHSRIDSEVFFTEKNTEYFRVKLRYNNFSLDYLCTASEIFEFCVANKSTPKLLDTEYEMLCLCLSILEVDTRMTEMIEAI